MNINKRGESTSRPVAIGVSGLLLCLLSSCGSERNITPVSGTVSQAGQPVEGVMVTFMPDPQRETDGAVSTAITDRDGRYELTYRGDSNLKGALVGHHRVVVKDVASENVRDASVQPPHRVPRRYSMSAQTPLAFEVSWDTESIDIELPSP